ncbi:MAG TPA: homoserine dehydrogenase, partial [Rhodospirillales bacterium]|nr:homoserine dehydrogenase [Rhodospirillales bacterium]
GVFADIAGILRDNSVSMEAVLQRARSPGEAVPGVLITHEAVEVTVASSLQQISALAACTEEPRMIRIEPF